MPDKFAIFLAASERPFTRWRELSGREQEAFIKKARRIKESCATHEPLWKTAP